MSQQILNNLESYLVIRTKINDNFTELYTNSGSIAGLSGNWESTYSTVKANSGSWGGSSINELSAKVLNIESSVEPNSGKWNSTYSTVHDNSGVWGNGGLPVAEFKTYSGSVDDKQHLQDLAITGKVSTITFNSSQHLQDIAITGKVSTGVFLGSQHAQDLTISGKVSTNIFNSSQHLQDLAITGKVNTSIFNSSQHLQDLTITGKVSTGTFNGSQHSQDLALTAAVENSPKWDSCFSIVSANSGIWNTDISGLSISVFKEYSGQIQNDQHLQDLAITGKVSTNIFNSSQHLQDLSITGKLNFNNFNTYSGSVDDKQHLQDLAITGKVMTSTFNSSQHLQDLSITGKLNLNSFNIYSGSVDDQQHLQDIAITGKVSTGVFNGSQHAQDLVISGKVSTSVFNSSQHLQDISITGKVDVSTFNDSQHLQDLAITGMVPSTITVTGEISDTTCFPLFVTATTGNLQPKTNTALVFNSSDGRFGATTLNAIGGTLRLQSSQVLSWAGVGNAVSIGAPAPEDIYFATNGLARLYLKGPTGNVGIHTSTPTANFQVNQGTTGVGTVTITGNTTCTGTGTQFLNTFKVGDSIIITATGETRAISAISSDTVMTIASATNTTGSAYTLASRVVLRAFGNGQVSIGGTYSGYDYKLFVDTGNIGLTPGYKLYSSGATNRQNYIEIYNAGTGGMNLSCGTATYDYPISILQNGVTVATVKTGKFGIGNTIPSELLTLGTAGTTAGTLSLAGATSGKAIINVQAVAGTPTLTLPTSTGTIALTSDNVASASELQTARLINGVAFNGSSNITTNTENWHGILARPVGGSNPLPTHITTTSFPLSASAYNLTYYYNGTAVPVTSDKTTTLSGTAGLYYIFFDGTTGNLLNGVFPGLSLQSNVLLAAVLWNGTDYGLVIDERHGYARNLSWHLWAHTTIGVRYRSGLTLTATGTGAGATFSTTGGEIDDEDIYFSINASSAFPTANACRIMWQNGAASYTFDKTPSTVPFKRGVNNRPVYIRQTDYAEIEMNSAVNRYINVFVYATTDLHTPIYMVTETFDASTAAANGYTSTANARAVGFPNLSTFGLSPEMRPIYRLVVRADGVVQTMVPEDDYRTVSSLPQAAGNTATIASAVSFTPYGNIAAANVQLGMQELDDEKLAISRFNTYSGIVDDYQHIQDLAISGKVSLAVFNSSQHAQDLAITGLIPSTITVVNESSDTTCYPLFGTAISGNLQPKSNANLTFNSATGNLSVTTLNNLTPTANADGFQIAGGTTSRTFTTIGGNITMTGASTNVINIFYYTLAADHDNGSPNPAAFTTVMTTNTLAAGKKYWYKIKAKYRTNAYTTGIGFAVKFSSPPTDMTFNQLLPLTNATNDAPFRTRAEDTTVVSTTTGGAADANLPYDAELWGEFTTNLATDFSLRVKSELNSTKVEVLTGTEIELIQVN